jgi:hypothetical protein
MDGARVQGLKTTSVVEMTLSLTTQDRCDIDVRVDLSAKELVRDYLSIQKPVLIKNVQQDASWGSLRDKYVYVAVILCVMVLRWSRVQFNTTHGLTVLRSVAIPYAKLCVVYLRVFDVEIVWTE